MEVAHPGVANDFGDVDARKYYPYYQWVCFVLFFQVSSPLPLFISDSAARTTRRTRATHGGRTFEGLVVVPSLCSPACLSADSRLSSTSGGRLRPTCGLLRRRSQTVALISARKDSYNCNTDKSNRISIHLLMRWSRQR